MAGSGGFLPGAHPDRRATGAGGFQLRRHVASRLDPGAAFRHLCLGGDADPEALTFDAFARVFAEPKGAIEHLVIGTGPTMLPLFELRVRLRAAGLYAEPMATAAAARTYSILLEEKRRVAAALVAVS